MSPHLLPPLFLRSPVPCALSGTLCLQLEHPQRVQATVAVVRYTSLAAYRLGVCSTFLSERLAPGQALPVYIHRNPDFRWAACWVCGLPCAVCSAGVSWQQ